MRRGPSSLPRERQNVSLIGRLASASLAKPVGPSRQSAWPAMPRQPGIGREVKLDRKARPVTIIPYFASVGKSLDVALLVVNLQVVTDFWMLVGTR